VADAISKGFDAPSTVYHQCSEEFIEIDNSVDFVISKGLRNFEGWM